MPPKGSKKLKAEASPEPAPKTPTKASKAAPKDIPTKQTPSKKPKEPTVFTKVPKETTTTGVIPIDVQLEGSSQQALQTKTGGYRVGLKLDSSIAFSVSKTYMINGGDLDGCQVILLKPAKPFKFLELPKEARKRVYMFYFAQRGVINEPIVLDAKRTNKDVYSKTYADGSKNRVGLLAVNKEVYDEAIQVFYAHTLRLESTTTLLDFMGQIPTNIKPYLKSLTIKNYIKTSSRNSMHFLAEAKNLTRLHFEAGVFGEGDPVKAAKQFYADAYKFLEAIGAGKGDKTAGVDVLSFGKEALQSKDDKKNLKPWSDVLVEEFKENLRLKVK
ncbi:hypothetical protein LTR78_004416 [Recurvomyces mirabilis]|uniref:Uncharacterized protein n=1 Tax=Recurvomyces mirabilis TaxID=574656 RepID=A0AAE1C2R5_9PEZI|nr:hypothetical protein LTR78_004416 [Recurvomyces mirabilis]KAK5155918.1 hypothetical protein LTS14_005484 [Recurvomyces mirabilis]